MLFCFILQRPSCSTLFPYTTLFRSFGPVRTVARISPLQPGRIFGHGGRLCRVLPHSDERREAAGRSARMGDHPRIPVRSEEHTSELQSRENLVCRLLLEKKK